MHYFWSEIFISFYDGSCLCSFDYLAHISVLYKLTVFSPLCPLTLKNCEVLVLAIDSGSSRYLLGFIYCYMDLKLPSLALLLLLLKAVYRLNTAFCY